MKRVVKFGVDGAGVRVADAAGCAGPDDPFVSVPFTGARVADPAEVLRD